MLQELLPFILEALILIFVSFIFGILITWLIWNKRLKKSTTEHEKSFNEKARELNESRTAFEEVNGKFKDLDVKVEDLKMRTKEAETRAEMSQEEIRHLENAVMEREEKLLHLQSSLKEAAHFKKKYEEISPKAQTKEKEVKSLEQKLLQSDTYKSELKELIEGLRPYRAKYEHIANEKEAMEKQLHEILIANRVLEQRLEHLGETGDTKSTNDSAYHEEIDKLKSSLQQLKKENERLNAKLDHGERDESPPLALWNSQGKLRWMETENKELKKELSSLKLTAEQSAEEQANLEASLIRLHLQLASKEDLPSGEEAKIEEHQGQELMGHNHEDEREEGSEQLAIIQQQLDMERIQLGHLEQELKDSLEENHRLRKQLDNKKSPKGLSLQTRPSKQGELVRLQFEIQKLKQLLSHKNEGSEQDHSTLPVDENEEEEILKRIKENAVRKGLDLSKLGTSEAEAKDDLKRIKGIGPFLEKKLNALGIFTFNQISELDEEDQEKLNDVIEFFPGRIQRDQWVDQAKELSSSE